MGFLFTSQKKIVYWAGLKVFKKKNPRGERKPKQLQPVPSWLF